MSLFLWWIQELLLDPFCMLVTNLTIALNTLAHLLGYDDFWIFNICSSVVFIKYIGNMLKIKTTFNKVLLVAINYFFSRDV